MLDYFVWDYIKNLIEHRRDDTETEVPEAILAACDTITRNGVICDAQYYSSRGIHAWVGRSFIINISLIIVQSTKW